MSTMKGDHVSEGKKYLEKGLKLVKKGDIDDAVDCFYNAASAFERAQDFRQIPALWEAIGNMLEPDFKEKHSEFLSALKNGKIRDVYDKWYQFPLVNRTFPASYSIWKERENPVHRQAWVYEWGAKYAEQSNLHSAAYRLFSKAAEKAEQTKDGKDYPDWPARLWYRAIYHNIHRSGPTYKEEIKQMTAKMESHYFRIKEQDKALKLLAVVYRTLKSSLVEAGRLTEAEQFKTKERSALMRYHFHSRRYLHAIAEGLSGRGFGYFIIGLFLLNLFIFPYIYYQWNLITSLSGRITFPDAILYSVESALGIDHGKLYAVGYGKLLSIIESALSWLGLGVFIWWLTRRLE